MDKRYAVFTFDQFYPSGGWNDLIFVGTKEELLGAYESLNLRDFKHIVDLEKGKKVSLKDLFNDE